MKLAIPNNRGSSYSLIGAMSSKKGLIHFKVLNSSNNSDSFYDFLLALKSKIMGTAYVVMDNLSVHKSKKVQSLFDDIFRSLYLPPYSCTLNPIERLWSMIKA